DVELALQLLLCCLLDGSLSDRRVGGQVILHDLLQLPVVALRVLFHIRHLESLGSVHSGHCSEAAGSSTSTAAVVEGGDVLRNARKGEGRSSL
ncbi:hypothetical protein PMAYCL1PPCAC_18723, partial [Pristionchus mayeri]